MKIARVVFLLLLAAPATWLLGQSHSSAVSPAQRAQQKLANIQQNGARPHPDPAPTVLTEDEINTYLASGAVRFPAGVQSVHLQGTAGSVAGTARVDFDKLTEGKRSANPMLSFFTGVHDVSATAQAIGSDGWGEVQVYTVSLDGVEIPRMALEYFVNHYVKPKYPGVGLDTRFKLPDRIDSATVGDHQLSIVQK